MTSKLKGINHTKAIFWRFPITFFPSSWPSDSELVSSGSTILLYRGISFGKGINFVLWSYMIGFKHIIRHVYFFVFISFRFRYERGRLRWRRRWRQTFLRNCRWQTNRVVVLVPRQKRNHLFGPRRRQERVYVFGHRIRIAFVFCSSY